MPHEQIEDSYIDPMADFVTVKVNKKEHDHLKGIIPCTYPECLSARAVQAAGEELEKLRGENATLRAAVNGFTFCHSDEAVMEEMGRLRMGVEGAYHRGVKQGLLLAEAAAEEIPTTVSVHATAHDASVATRCKEAIVMAIGAVQVPVAAECQWGYDDCEYAPKWDTSCGEAWCFIEGGPKENRVEFCPYCGKPVKVTG